jgi:hypothetical protein
MRVARRWTAAWLLASGLAGSTVAAHAGEASFPFEAKWQHVGVATCAGSNCHGSQRPFDDSPVLQNEYFLWQRDDAHSNAYKLLVSPAGKRIAANLGIKDVGSAPECLTCHTDDVPAAQRGRRYSVSEGVGCEACHGGAQNWLGPHVSGNSHAQNIDAGLYPLEDPVARARLCVHCHMGTAKKPIDHRIMGAGHPPLDFELDTFTNIQPAHFRVDADYRQRKPAYAPGAKVWAIGQLVAAETFLDGLLGDRFADKGTFPELVFFDCNACHHAMRPPRWNPGVGGPLGPGEPRLADAYLAMSAVVLGVLAPDAAKQWDAALADLHRASAESVGKTRDVARRLRQITGSALDGMRGKNVSKSDAATLIDRLAEVGIERRAGDYTASKQIYYGIDALLAFLKTEHGLAKGALQGEMDQLFAAVDAQRSYDPAATQAALRKVRGSVDKLR